jgi:hypothetical protein
MAQEMPDVSLCPGEEIVEAGDIMPLLYQPVNEMGAKKSGSACYKNSLCHDEVFPWVCEAINTRLNREGSSL